MKKGLIGAVVGVSIVLVLCGLGWLATWTTSTLENASLRRSLEEQSSSLAAVQARVKELESEKLDMEKMLQQKNTAIETASAKVTKLESDLAQAKSAPSKDRFFFYYAPKVKPQSFGVDKLDQYLANYKWPLGKYQLNVFDCSEMAAYLEWRLENEGFNTLIATGKSPDGKATKHAWLMVETSAGSYMPVEPTTVSVVRWSDPYFANYFTYERILKDIHEALALSDTEFDWWNSTG